MEENVEILLRGIVAWMREEGIAPTRTRVIKFLYLADLQYARYHNGHTFMGWRWYIDSFGPFATEALRLLDRAVDEGWLKSTVLERDEGDTVENRSGRAIIYDLPDFASIERAKESLPIGFGAVRNWIKRYGPDTNALLRFVYGTVIQNRWRMLSRASLWTSLQPGLSRWPSR